MKKVPRSLSRVPVATRSFLRDKACEAYELAHWDRQEGSNPRSNGNYAPSLTVYLDIISKSSP